MNPYIQKYPLDLYKNNLGNYVSSEPFDLSKQYGKVNRCVSFNGGYFFSDTVVIRDGNGQTLIPDIDYIFTHLNPTAVKESGSPVFGMIVIINPNIGDVLFLSGHLIGGKYSTLNPIIIDCIKYLEGQTVTAPDWNYIVDKPDSFRPSGHYMLWGQMYGFTPFTFSVNELKEQVANLSLAELDQKLYDKINLLNDLKRKLELLKDKFNYHIKPGQNSHKTTATDLGLAAVDNYPIISTDEIKNLENLIPTRYVDSVKHNELVKYWLSVKLNHIHPISLTALDTYSSGELNSKIDEKVSKDDSAKYTRRLDGYNLAAIVDSLPVNYSATEFTEGLFQINKYSTINSLDLGILINDGKFHSYAQLLDNNYLNNQNILIIGNYDSIYEAMDFLNNNYKNSNKLYAFFTLNKKVLDVDGNTVSFEYTCAASNINNNWIIPGV